MHAFFFSGELSSCHLETCYNRILKRYLNMRSKEYVKVLKQNLNRKKELAHRKKVEGKSGKRKAESQIDRVDKFLIDSITNDKTEECISSHLIMKAKAIAGSSVFVKLSKADLHCLFRLYDLKFVCKTKKILSQMLSERILASDKMLRPDRVQAARFARIRENHKIRKEIDDFPDVDINPTQNNERNRPEPSPTDSVVPIQASNSGDQEPANARRRAQFKPSPAQIQLLLQDHSKQPNKELNELRATEFSVHISQIVNWHKRKKKKDKQSA